MAILCRRAYRRSAGTLAGRKASNSPVAKVFLFALCGISALGQTFEVATVKRSPDSGSDKIYINLGSVAGRKITFGNASLSDCLKYAYGLVSDEQLIGPDWIKSKAIRFDITGEGPAGTGREDFPAMLRQLLMERLIVKLHHE